LSLSCVDLFCSVALGIVTFFSAERLLDTSIGLSHSHLRSDVPFLLDWFGPFPIVFILVNDE
jgi:hypothetical protein